FANLHVGAVEGSDGQCSVHGELHVAGAGRLFTGGGNLLRKVGGRIDALAILDVKVGDEHNLEQLVHLGVAVDDVGDGVDQLDNQLRHAIAGRCFASEEESARGDLG